MTNRALLAKPSLGEPTVRLLKAKPMPGHVLRREFGQELSANGANSPSWAFIGNAHLGDHVPEELPSKRDINAEGLWPVDQEVFDDRSVIVDHRRRDLLRASRSLPIKQLDPIPEPLVGAESLLERTARKAPVTYRLHHRVGMLSKVSNLRGIR